MIWRTDKPTADVIAVYLKGSGYPQVLEYDKEKQCYLEEHNSPVNIQDIVKWADLEEDEKQTDISIISNNLKEAAEEYAKDETMSGLAERAFKAGANWQREQLRDLCYQCEKN